MTASPILLYNEPVFFRKWEQFRLQNFVSVPPPVDTSLPVSFDLSIRLRKSPDRLFSAFVFQSDPPNARTKLPIESFIRFVLRVPLIDNFLGSSLLCLCLCRIYMTGPFMIVRKTALKHEF